MPTIKIHGMIEIPKSLVTAIKELNDLVATAKIPNPQFFMLKNMGKYAPEHIIAFKEDKAKGVIYLKRGCLRTVLEIAKRHNIKIVDCRVQKKQILKFPQIELYDYQEVAVNELTKHEQGLIVAPVGAGKTYMGLKIIEKIKEKTLIIVPTQEIGKQWATDLSTNKVSNQFIKSGVKYDKNLQCHIVTIHSFNKIDMLEYGCVLLDECHRTPAKMYTDSLDSIPAKFRYGLTGTAYRKDGLTDLIFWNLASIKHTVPNSAVKTISPKYHQVSTPWKYFNLDNNFTDLISYMVTSDERNDFIVDHINSKRGTKKSLVVTHRVEHCELLAKRLNTKYILHGSLKPKEREDLIKKFKAAKTGTLVSLYSIVSEGFNVPNLEYVFLTTPSNNKRLLVQTIGRIVRDYPDKKPLAFDYVDINVALLKAQARKRLKYFIEEWGSRHVKDIVV